MVYLNGNFIAKKQASISVMDRGFLFGDGVYEVIPTYQGKLFRLDAHLKRLQNSLDAIKISNPYSNSEWQKILNQLLGYSQSENQSLYYQRISACVITLTPFSSVCLVFVISGFDSIYTVGISVSKLCFL
jgi:branched-subunit amino acid aminotransferase/4-amino-4-deoxychorismate lyase